MTLEEVDRWKKECTEKFNGRYVYPPFEAFGKYKEDEIRIFDTVDNEYFYSTPANHKKSGTGKPRAKSGLEEMVKTLFVQKNIPFEAEYKMPEWERSPIDFLVNGSVAIECQGQHHFSIVKGMGGEAKTTTQILTDRDKAVMMANKGYTVVYLSEYEYPDDLKADFIHYFTTDNIDEFLNYIVNKMDKSLNNVVKEYTVEDKFLPFTGFCYSDELQARVVYMFENSRKLAKDIAHELKLTDQDIIAILKLNGITTDDIILKRTIFDGKPIFTISKETGEITNAFLTSGHASDYLESIGHVSHALNKHSAPIYQKLTHQNYTLYGEYYRFVEQATPEQRKVINEKLKENYPVKILKWVEMA